MALSASSTKRFFFAPATNSTASSRKCRAISSSSPSASLPLKSPRSWTVKLLSASPTSSESATILLFHTMPLKPSQIEFTRAEQRGVFIATPECLMEPRSYVLTGVAADGASLGIVHIHPLRRLLAILLALAESPFPHQTRR